MHPPFTSVWHVSLEVLLQRRLPSMWQPCHASLQTPCLARLTSSTRLVFSHLNNNRNHTRSRIKAPRTVQTDMRTPTHTADTHALQMHAGCTPWPHLAVSQMQREAQRTKTLPSAPESHPSLRRKKQKSKFPHQKPQKLSSEYDVNK